MASTETASPAAAAGPSSRRAMVVDVAYSRLEVAGRPGLRIGPLVESINSPYVVVNGVRRPAREAWTAVFADALTGADPQAITLAHPTAWGTLRTSLLTEAIRTAVDDRVALSVVPRAVAIAQAHMESSAQMCVVAECHDGRLDVHQLTRDAGHWSVTATSVFDETLDDDEAADALEPLVGDAVEAILVDGDNRDRVAATLGLFDEHTPTGRIAAVERVLLHRHGGTRQPAPPLTSAPVGSAAPRSRAQTVAIVTAASAVLVAVLVAVIVVAPWRTDTDDAQRLADTARADRTTGDTPTPAGVTADVGRVSVTVPAGWRRTSDPADDDGAVPFTTFAARSDDRRIILVQNSVRSDSTIDTVAVSLRNRLDQRGTDVVTEFSPRTRYGDRDVIGYRETPVSGGQIRWYVVVESALQVSVGCQDGGQGQSVDAECLAAVRSVAIAP
ncbi:type VII secretion-associated protein [Williamsia maris]|uniref:Type VII secretion-associated protein, Rv3446c family, C-terminal domain-containing protein n=1 Tax=Williamsia maris TaxID=72806 RepID=A0ABT1H8B4_9NOCA|nr:type VII secretion-associated protein [Williamsia maris]MCP2174414.1 type VII secretion-associated protein, Rv3446c family, C-terminal domain-containing protein [Williamsia maris]